MRRTVNQLETAFDNICNSSYPNEWDENHISFSLMKELRSIFSNREIQFNDWSKIVDWQSFKNRGKQESSFGDIALIVNVQFSSGETLRGVAHIEAKRSFKSGNFESMDLPQLSRIKSNAPYSHLILYAHQKQQLQLKFPDETTWKSHMWISPINTAHQLLNQTSTENWKVLRTSFPFAMFLTSRIFWGFDLDFREEVYKDIVEGINKVSDPSFLGVVNVFYEGQNPVRIALADNWEQL
jgi:hypothetical protein